MPKAKATNKAAISTATEAQVEIKVSAGFSASVLAVFTSTAAVDSALRTQEQSWVKCAALAAKEYKDEDEAAAALKAAFHAQIEKLLTKVPDEQKEQEKKRLELKYGVYRSKIKALAFPADPKSYAQALEDNLSINDLLPVARGNKKRNKKGEWIDVENTGKRKAGSGGHNRKAPIESLKASLALAFTAALTAKIDEEQLAVAIIESLEDGFSLADLIKQLQEKAEE